MKTVGTTIALASSSPAIDYASQVDNLVAATDFAGSTRPHDCGYDEGAYEFTVATRPPNASRGLTATVN